MSGNLTNTGRGIVFKVTPKLTDTDPEVSISSGPLSYRYTLHHLELHFGRDISRGSEHSIESFRYPGGKVNLIYFISCIYVLTESESVFFSRLVRTCQLNRKIIFFFCVKIYIFSFPLSFLLDFFFVVCYFFRLFFFSSTSFWLLLFVT